MIIYKYCYSQEKKELRKYSKCFFEIRDVLQML